MNAIGRILCGLLAISLLLATPARSDKDEKNDRKRAEIDAMAEGVLKELFTSSETAKELYEKSVGYAVFSNVKVQFVIAGGGGHGVAVAKDGKRTYMNMGTAGAGLGIGAHKYHVVFLFQTGKAMKSFIEKGWQADASAQAALAEEAAGAAASFKKEIMYYQLTDKGIIASADITGTKYWKSGDLNEAGAPDSTGASGGQE